VSRRAQSALIFAAAAAVTFAFLIDFCALVYQCGCKSLWAGAAAACNIHRAGVKHCPWCSLGAAGYHAVTGVILAAEAAMSFLAPWRWPARFAAACAMFPVVGGLEALVIGVALGYWS
jgi:hypothetical protein